MWAPISCPRLVTAGHEVVNVSHGASKPYTPHAAWDSVETVVLDRETAEASGDFGQKIAALKPEIVVDMICFTSARHLFAALHGRVGHFLSCGTTGCTAIRSPCPRGVGFHAGDCKLGKLGRRGLRRRFAPGPHAPRIRRSRCRPVRTRGQPRLPAVRRNGRPGRPRKRLRPPGSTSPVARHAASRRPNA